MMRNVKTHILLFSVVLIAATFYSCANPPTADMDAAAAAVAKAESDADAKTYAPDSLKRATDALARMRAEADAKRYDAAKTLAQEAVQAADKALADGKAGLERAKNEASSGIGAAKAAALEAENALAGARRTRGVALDFAALSRDIEAAKRIIAAAESDSAGGNFLAAAEKARSARSTLGDLVNRISNALRAASAKK